MQVHCLTQKLALGINVSLSHGCFLLVKWFFGNKTPLDEQFPKVCPVEQHSHEIHLKKVFCGPKRGMLGTVSCSWKFIAYMSTQYIVLRAGETVGNKTCKILLFTELTLW